MSVSHYASTGPEWAAVGLRLDDDRKGIIVASTPRSLDIDSETEDVSSFGSPLTRPFRSRVNMTITMDEYILAHGPTYDECLSTLPDLRAVLAAEAPSVSISTAMHTLFHLASEHVTTKEQATALEKVAEFLGY